MLPRLAVRSLFRASVRGGRPAAVFAAPVRRALATSSIRSNSTPLSMTLAKEIEFENEGEIVLPPSLEELQSAGVWTVSHGEGKDKIELTRSYGNEKIKIATHISDIDSEDAEFEDEEVTQVEEDDNGVTDENLTIYAKITVTKPGSADAIAIDTVVEDGEFIIEDVSYASDAAILEDSQKADELYLGPEFTSLDESVQTGFEDYLVERGVDATLALVLPDLIEYTEEKEYREWLGRVKTFLEK